MPLLIYDTPEKIHYTQTILDFIMLAVYVLHNQKMLRYIEYILYRCEKTKITFEQYQFIDSKLCQLTFNYFKFHAMSHFVQCI